MPHVLIKYAHVLVCISAGEGSRRFSAFHCRGVFHRSMAAVEPHPRSIAQKAGWSVARGAAEV